MPLECANYTALEQGYRIQVNCTVEELSTVQCNNSGQCIAFITELGRQIECKCAQNFTGDQCELTLQAASTWGLSAILLGVILAALLLTVLILTVYFCIRRQQFKQRKKNIPAGTTKTEMQSNLLTSDFRATV